MVKIAKVLLVRHRNCFYGFDERHFKHCNTAALLLENIFILETRMSSLTYKVKIHCLMSIYMRLDITTRRLRRKARVTTINLVAFHYQLDLPNLSVTQNEMWILFDK